MITALYNGYLYHKQTMLMLNEVLQGNEIFLHEEAVDVFYGTLQQAINFGIIFKEYFI